MAAPSSPVVINFRALWQPHVHVALLEVNGAILDGRMIGNEPDLRQRGDQVRLQPQNLVSVRGNPRPAFQRHRIRWALAAEPVGANCIRLIASLAEMHLPRESLAPTRQPFYQPNLPTVFLIRFDVDLNSVPLLDAGFLSSYSCPGNMMQ